MNNSENELLQTVEIKKTHYRIESIDLLRGIVIIIMALDHSRQFLGYGSFFAHPTDLATTTPFLFFTRWITHFCAPVFVFLAGTSAYLFGNRKNKKMEVSTFLITRGLWLIILEFTVINFAWTFDINLSFQVFQVIWAIGLSMIFLAFIIHLPAAVIFGIGIVLTAGHNILDSYTVSGNNVTDILWYILHQSNLVVEGNSVYLFLYPVIPWIGTMILGYLFGELYSRDYNPDKRKRILSYLGFGCILLFTILRSINIYGDPVPWQSQKNFTYTILSFFNTTKYPPSFLYLLMTLGPSFLILRYTEVIRNWFSDALVVIGRVPLFFYVIHIYAFHIAASIGIVITGRPLQDTIMTSSAFINQYLLDFGFSLWVVYIVWIGVVLLLFPLCRMYNNYKQENRAKWWLSYL